jgi:hypothetical protein
MIDGVVIPFGEEHESGQLFGGEAGIFAFDRCEIGNIVDACPRIDQVVFRPEHAR